jgi:hypothetical protein
MYLQNIFDQFRTSLISTWDGVIGFVPNFLAAVIVFIIGWVFSSMLGKIVAQLINALKLDNIFRSMQFDQVVEKAGFHLSVGNFIGAIVKWFFIIVFLVASVNIVDLPYVNDFLVNVVLNFIPKVAAAAVILVLGAVLAQALRRLVSGSARAADLPSAHFLGGVSYWAIWIFAIIAALDKLGVFTPNFQSTFGGTILMGLVAMIAIAGGIAFGLGGKDVAGRYLEDMKREISEK